MPRPLSNDLRERALACSAAGASDEEVARAFSIGRATVVRWKRRYRETGSVVPARMGGHRPCKIAGADRDWLLERMAAADFTIRGLVRELAERGLVVDYRTMWRFVRREGLSFKKKHSAR